LLAPLTSFTTLQRQLTTIDLQLDPVVRQRYELIKLIFLSPSEDWELARQNDDELRYDRNRADPGEPDRESLLSQYPACYAPQGRALRRPGASASASSSEHGPLRARTTALPQTAIGSVRHVPLAR
jgi:hypothetical protein